MGIVLLIGCVPPAIAFNGPLALLPQPKRRIISIYYHIYAKNKRGKQSSLFFLEVIYLRIFSSPSQFPVIQNLIIVVWLTWDLL